MVEDLPLPRKKEFLFRYGVMELNTAVKPWMFAHLKALGYRHVVYLDPDILVLDRLADVERLLDEGATGVLLPHLTAPIDDGRRPAELDIMRSGTYNLGFLALGDTPAVGPFIDWWKSKLEFDAASDIERGLFTDQKWMDLAPALFEGFAILRDPGYDVAYWNLSHRPIARAGRRMDGREQTAALLSFQRIQSGEPEAVLQASEPFRPRHDWTGARSRAGVCGARTGARPRPISDESIWLRLVRRRHADSRSHSSAVSRERQPPEAGW